MLSSEILEFFGIKEAERRSEMLTLVNGMMGFVEASRRASWDQFCEGISSAKEELKRCRAEMVSLKTDKSKLIEKNLQFSDEIKKQLTFNENLNKAVKEQLAKIQALEDEKKRLLATVETAKRTAEKKDEDLKAEKARCLKLASEMKELASQKTDDEDEEYAQGQEEGGEMQEDGPPVACGEEYAKLKKQNERLLSENARLDSLVTALTRAAEQASNESSKEERKQPRASVEEVNKLRKLKIEQAAKLEAIGEEARAMAHKYSEYIAENDAGWEKKLVDLRRANESLRKEVEELKKKEPSMALVPAKCSHNLSSFMMRGGMLMLCPVPIRTGFMMQLYDVYTQWKNSACDNEGSFYATFQCPFTGQTTSLATSEQVYLLSKIAANLRISMAMPLRFQHFSRGKWVDFSFYDQIAIVSMCCKLHRTGTANAAENVLVCQGVLVLVVHILDNVVDLQVHATHNSSDSNPARLMEFVTAFFERWTFRAPESMSD